MSQRLAGADGGQGTIFLLNAPSRLIRTAAAARLTLRVTASARRNATWRATVQPSLRPGSGQAWRGRVATGVARTPGSAVPGWGGAGVGSGGEPGDGNAESCWSINQFEAGEILIGQGFFGGMQVRKDCELSIKCRYDPPPLKRRGRVDTHRKCGHAARDLRPSYFGRPIV